LILEAKVKLVCLVGLVVVEYRPGLPEVMIAIVEEVHDRSPDLPL
jgi:hypothetical protein